MKIRKDGFIALNVIQYTKENQDTLTQSVISVWLNRRCKMNQKELDNLKCTDKIQCKNHPKVKRLTVNLFDAQNIDETDTQCGCKVSDFIIISCIKKMETK